MTDIILGIIIIVIVGTAVIYIRKESKRGVKCIGCPDAENCAHKANEAAGCNSGGGCSGCNGNCGCCGHTDIK